MNHNQMVEKTISSLGSPDILINNAGINVFSEPLKCLNQNGKELFLWI